MATPPYSQVPTGGLSDNVPEQPSTFLGTSGIVSGGASCLVIKHVVRLGPLHSGVSGFHDAGHAQTLICYVIFLDNLLGDHVCRRPSKEMLLELIDG